MEIQVYGVMQGLREAIFKLVAKDTLDRKDNLVYLDQAVSYFLLSHYSCKCRPNFRLTVKFGANLGTAGFRSLICFKIQIKIAI